MAGDLRDSTFFKAWKIQQEADSPLTLADNLRIDSTLPSGRDFVVQFRKKLALQQAAYVKSLFDSIQIHPMDPQFEGPTPVTGKSLADLTIS